MFYAFGLRFMYSISFVFAEIQQIHAMLCHILMIIATDTHFLSFPFLSLPFLFLPFL